jgi:hypothetical protein
MDLSFSSRHLESIGGRTGHPLVAMDFFDQRADQRFSVQGHPVLGLDLGEQLGDVKRALGLPKYVSTHVHLRHTFS